LFHSFKTSGLHDYAVAIVGTLPVKNKFRISRQGRKNRHRGTWFHCDLTGGQSSSENAPLKTFTAHSNVGNQFGYL